MSSKDSRDSKDSKNPTDKDDDTLKDVASLDLDPEEAEQVDNNNPQNAQPEVAPPTSSTPQNPRPWFEISPFREEQLSHLPCAFRNDPGPQASDSSEEEARTRQQQNVRPSGLGLLLRRPPSPSSSESSMGPPSQTRETKKDTCASTESFSPVVQHKMNRQFTESEASAEWNKALDMQLIAVTPEQPSTEARPPSRTTSSPGFLTSMAGDNTQPGLTSSSSGVTARAGPNVSPVVPATSSTPDRTVTRSRSGSIKRSAPGTASARSGSVKRPATRTSSTDATAAQPSTSYSTAPGTSSNPPTAAPVLSTGLPVAGPSLFTMTLGAIANNASAAIIKHAIVELMQSLPPQEKEDKKGRFERILNFFKKSAKKSQDEQDEKKGKDGKDGKDKKDDDDKEDDNQGEGEVI